MNDQPSEAEENLSPSTIEFWETEARDMKEAADMCWAADTTVKQRIELLQRYSTSGSMNYTMEGAEIELNILYRHLIALAIQYLAIGILIRREPQRFIREQPGHHIVALVEECSVSLSTTQRRLLSDIENAYEWSDRYPQLSEKLQDTELRIMTQKMAGKDVISQVDKEALDEVYARLNGIVQGYLVG